MSRRRIVVTLGRDGTVRAETRGILGGECIEAIPLLEDLLEAEAIDSSLTADYYAVETSTLGEDRARLRNQLGREDLR